MSRRTFGLLILFLIFIFSGCVGEKTEIIEKIREEDLLEIGELLGGSNYDSKFCFGMSLVLDNDEFKSYRIEKGIEKSALYSTKIMMELSDAFVKTGGNTSTTELNNVLKYTESIVGEWGVGTILADTETACNLADKQFFIYDYYNVVDGGSVGNMLYLLSDYIIIPMNTSVEIPDFYYNIEYEPDGELNIRRNESAWGVKLKDSQSDYEPVLDEDLDDDGYTPDNILNLSMAVPSGGDPYSGKIDLDTPYYIKDEMFFLNSSRGKGLIFDENQDGDLKDSDDYMVYNYLYVLDGMPDAKVRLAWGANMTNLKGRIVRIKGINFLITDLSMDYKYIKVGPAIYRTLTAQSVVDYTDAVVYIETIKMLAVDSDGDTLADKIYIYDDSSLEGVVDVPAYTGTDLSDDIHKTSYVLDSYVLDNYKVFLTSGNSSTHSIQVSIVPRNMIVRVDNNDKYAFGYMIAKVADDYFASPGREFVSSAEAFRYIAAKYDNNEKVSKEILEKTLAYLECQEENLKGEGIPFASKEPIEIAKINLEWGKDFINRQINEIT